MVELWGRGKLVGGVIWEVKKWGRLGGGEIYINKIKYERG